jgi:hypothetical protein
MTTETDKDPGIDEIVKMNIPPEDKVHYIADLCKHRGRMMDQDLATIKEQAITMGIQLNTILFLRQQLIVRSPWDHFKIWMNGWAKS